MSNNCVTLILKTVIDKSQLLGFEYFASLVLEHSSSDSGLYGQTLISVFPKALVFAYNCILSQNQRFYPLMSPGSHLFQHPDGSCLAFSLFFLFGLSIQYGYHNHIDNLIDTGTERKHVNRLIHPVDNRTYHIQSTKFLNEFVSNVRRC